MATQPALERSRRNRVFAGVCGGIGENLRVDPTLIRLGFVVLGFLGGLGVLLYLALLLVLPEAGGSSAAAIDLRPGRGRAVAGLALIALGAIWLFSNAGAFRLIDWGVTSSLALVALGLALLVRRR